MSSNMFTTITSILPNPRTPIVRNPDVTTKQSPVSPVEDVRQEIAISSQIVPADQVAEDRKQQSRDNRLDLAVSDINSYVQNINRKLQFTVDEALPLGRAVIKVIDSETDEVIREIPSEEVLAIARRISEQLDENTSLDGLVFIDRA